ncbi:MAG: methyltransferase domain-containing protein, partial [Phycisphaerales bacterium]|nr:methyltransferase domain-containing protein [Phycisphaerales bacterium]
LEIIVADDGSTDSSVDTCRAWAQRTWPDGRPFCRLIEMDHVGVLSVVANRLVREARGDVLCRLDGDIICRTPHWAARLLDWYDRLPDDVGVVGPKQLAVDGRVHAAGDWILHPRGYHHVAQGARPEDVTDALEVDHVMGCFYTWRRAVQETVGDFDESFLRGQTIDYGLRVRHHGWRAFAVPDIEFVHAHSERRRRPTDADTNAGVRNSLARFREKWGFDRLAPDLDVVRERYAGSPLLWNPSVFGEMPAAPVRTLEASTWQSFATDAHCQREFAACVRMTLSVLATGRRTDGPIVQFGCGDGVLAHLLAREGFDVVALDEDASAVELARQVTVAATAPARYAAVDRLAPWPADTGTARLVLLLDVLDRHSNPRRVLDEARRVLAPDGLLVVTVAERRLHGEDDAPGHHPYRAHELNAQLSGVGGFTIVQAPRPTNGAAPVFAVARRCADDAYIRHFSAPPALATV